MIAILNRLSIILIIGILVIIVPGTLTAFNLQVEDSFDIPGLTGNIVAFDFCVNNENGHLEIAATDGSNIVVYSTVTDELLFSTTINTPYTISHILLDDVNRDSIPDIVIGTKPAFDYGPSVFYHRNLVQLYDGLSNYQLLDSAIYITERSTFTIYPLFKTFKTMDWNEDGYNEFIISLDSLEAHNNSYDMCEYIRGKTRTYYSFPDSLNNIGSGDYLISRPILLEDSGFDNEILTTRRTGRYTEIGDNNLDLYFYAATISNTGTINFLCGIHQPFFCGGYNSVYLDDFSPQCIMRFDNTSPILFIITKYEWNQDGDDNPYFPDTSGSEIIMHKLVSADSVEEFWTVTNHGYYDLVYDSDYPGSFFGISSTDNSIVQFNGFDGSVHARSQSLGSGVKSWDDPYNDGSTKLVVVEDDNVKIYGPDIVTDINQNSEEQILPKNFTLYQPYPNPFNATLSIPIKLNHKAHTTIEAFNLLGQKTDIIYDGHLSSGEQKIQWNAGVFSSGIYLIKVTVDDQTQSVKAVLLK